MIGEWWARRRAAREARRTYRELCDLGRAPQVHVHISLMTDRGDDWTGMDIRGITGIKTSGIPLTPEGIRYITGIAEDIRGTCIRQLLKDQQCEAAGDPT